MRRFSFGFLVFSWTHNCEDVTEFGPSGSHVSESEVSPGRHYYHYTAVAHSTTILNLLELGTARTVTAGAECMLMMVAGD